MLFLAKYIHTITIKIVTKIKHTDLRTVVTFGEGYRGTNSDEPQRHHTACKKPVCKSHMVWDFIYDIGEKTNLQWWEQLSSCQGSRDQTLLCPGCVDSNVSLQCTKIHRAEIHDDSKMVAARAGRRQNRESQLGRMKNVRRQPVAEVAERRKCTVRLKRLSDSVPCISYHSKNVDRTHPGWWGSVDWVPTHKLKGGRFNSQSGLTPGLWDEGEATCRCFSRTSKFLSLSFSLSSPLSKNK